MIEFFKYQGTGNDFILIDNRTGVVKADKVELAKKWCSRRFGIGSDGIIFIENAPGVDFKMDFYNPDGSQSFCGNGSRCAVAFAKWLGIIENKANFLAIDGNHDAEIEGETVKIAMHQYNGVRSIESDYFIDTGSPHYIHFQGQNESLDIVDYGRKIRYSEPYKQAGTNVNIVDELGADHIAVQTYERGVEAETFACGTGATACGLGYAFKHQLKNGKVAVDVKGGALTIHFEAGNAPDQFKNIWLEGPAKFVFKGELDDRIA